MILRAPVPGQGLASIEVHKGRTHGKAFYHGLMACGSVWTCPICAAKIAERRRVELQQALDAAKAKGWGIHFVTLTVPHGIGDDLHEILGKLSTALKKLSGNAPFKKAKAQTGKEPIEQRPADLIPAEFETLKEEAAQIEGFNGSKGAMPPKGGSPSLSDDEIKEVVNFMVAKAQ